MYADHLKHYYKHFDNDQIKVIFFEDFIKDSTKVLNSVYDFLGVEENTSLKHPKKFIIKLCIQANLIRFM